MQTSPQIGPLVVKSIPDDSATFLEMERLAQNTRHMVTHAGTDENGEKTLFVYETHNNSNIQHDLDLWHLVREYEKANAELPFTPVLSRK